MITVTKIMRIMTGMSIGRIVIPDGNPAGAAATRIREKIEAEAETELEAGSEEEKK